MLIDGKQMSDSGWGCTVRCGQMFLINYIIQNTDFVEQKEEILQRL